MAIFVCEQTLDALITNILLCLWQWYSFTTSIISKAYMRIASILGYGVLLLLSGMLIRRIWFLYAKQVDREVDTYESMWIDHRLTALSIYLALVAYGTSGPLC
jgi:hypothetical protein